MRKKKEIKTEFYSFLILPIVALTVFAIALAAAAIVFFTDAAKDRTVLTDIICAIGLIVVPFLIFIYMLKLGGGRVKISEKGIRSSLFKKFFVREIKWEDISDIRVFKIGNGGEWLFFSKSYIGGMQHWKVQKNKDQIKVLYSKEVHMAIRLFADKAINDAPISEFKIRDEMEKRKQAIENEATKSND